MAGRKRNSIAYPLVYTLILSSNPLVLLSSTCLVLRPNSYRTSKTSEHFSEVAPVNCCAADLHDKLNYFLFYDVQVFASSNHTGQVRFFRVHLPVLMSSMMENSTENSTERTSQITQQRARWRTPQITQQLAAAQFTFSLLKGIPYQNNNKVDDLNCLARANRLSNGSNSTWPLPPYSPPLQFPSLQFPQWPPAISVNF